jgi:hypothetical protein
MLSLLAPQSLSIGGTLAAPEILLQAQSVAWTDSTILTGSYLPDSGVPEDITTPPDPTLSGVFVPGVFVTAGVFTQNGTARVAPLAGRNQAALDVLITGTGTAHFTNLVAPSTQLLLDLRRGGRATGAIDVAGLNIYAKGYPDNQAPQPPQAPTLLTGEVGTYTGTAAAGAGYSHATPNINYQLNGCPVESLNCVLLSPLSVPVTQPISDFDVDTSARRRDDDDALPNVADVDY